MKGVEVRAETQANVWQVRCAAGDRVAAGQEIVILESMKMEIPVESPVTGVVRELRVAEGSPVKEGDVVAVLDPE
jgi:biotin carboxyl carrier protein